MKRLKGQGLKVAMQAAPGGDDATVENENRFRLRRPSGKVESEFHDGGLRVFYPVKGAQALVDAIERKRSNHLLIGGHKMTL